MLLLGHSIAPTSTIIITESLFITEPPPSAATITESLTATHAELPSVTAPRTTIAPHDNHYKTSSYH